MGLLINCKFGFLTKNQAANLLNIELWLNYFNNNFEV